MELDEMTQFKFKNQCFDMCKYMWQKETSTECINGINHFMISLDIIEHAWPHAKTDWSC